MYKNVLAELASVGSISVCHSLHCTSAVHTFYVKLTIKYLHKLMIRYCFNVVVVLQAHDIELSVKMYFPT